MTVEDGIVELGANGAYANVGYVMNNPGGSNAAVYYDKTVDQLRVVHTDFGGQEDPNTITISNEGNVPARLMSRHWIITDANGKVQEVSGDGVVGEQPHLKPGEEFRYSSGAVLETPVGAMQGLYRMRADDGVSFDAPIAPFTLAVPGMLH